MDAARKGLLEILEEILPEGLPQPWADDRPLLEAGLDSVGVLTLVSEIEARFEISLAEAELSEENFATLNGLLRLVAVHGEA